VTDTTQPAGHATPIYRGMDRAALDAAYNNSAAVADSAEYLARWRERSAQVRAMPGARLDLPYGAAPRAIFDYLPAPGSAWPLFVFIHGGYWQRNSKDMFAFVADGPHAHGIAVAVLGYTLAPEARLSGIVAEIAQALTVLAGKAGDLGFDADRIYVGGWSAGGHLTACASLLPTVRGGLAISGIYDLEPMSLCYINDKLRLDRNEIATLSPLRTLRVGMAPLHLAVGSGELSELQRQSTAMKARADELGLPVTLGVLPGRHHYSIMDELAKPDGLLTAELLRLVSGTEKG
jgi:arylformamidase